MRAVELVVSRWMVAWEADSLGAKGILKVYEALVDWRRRGSFGTPASSAKDLMEEEGCGGVAELAGVVGGSWAGVRGEAPWARRGRERAMMA